MAQRENLFPEAAVVLSPDSSHGEPRLWLRRLAIWAKPGEVVRDISLRRGLNIVWSPDPGAEVADLGRDTDSGHGAGKTLFCRLIRYCLGEDTFANDELRRSIAQAFPAGLVGAELLICGDLWSVLRPIGHTRRHDAKKGATLEQLLDNEESSAGIQTLVDALNTLLTPDNLRPVIPELRESSAWPFALSWLSRDQECRFDHILDWRHPRSESRSPVLSKDQAFGAVRAFWGVLDNEESSLKTERIRLSEQKKSSEQDSSYLHRRAEDLRSELMPALSLDPSASIGGPLDLSTLRSAADEQTRLCRDESTARPFNDDILRAREGRDVVLQHLAVIDEDVKRAQETERFHQEQIKVLRGERANLDAAEIKARLGPVCPVCRVPIDLALAEGCAISHLLRDPDTIKDEKQDVATRLQHCNEGITASRSEVTTLNARRSLLNEERVALDAKLSVLEGKADKQLQDRQQRWFRAKRLTDDVAQYADLLGRISKTEQGTVNLDKRDEELRDSQAALRNRHSDALKRINDIFSYVCRGLLGNQVSAKIELSASGLQASVEVGGQAMESLKAIAFDLAGILLSLEGRSGVPAFCMHDSPREADLGQSIYHRTFRLIRSCELVAAEPMFQYIITTTSTPPNELSVAPYVVARLSGSTVEERLLRRNLR
jgi:hypothetical protein